MGTIVKVGGGLASAGAGKGLYYVELPRSKFYGDVAEWVTTNTVDGVPDPSLQIVCNGELWIVTETGIQSRSLATKQITYSEEGTYYLWGGGRRALGTIVTDGVSRIWFTAYTASVISSSSSSDYLNLYQFNVLTHDLLTFQLVKCSSTSSNSQYGFGGLVYSSVYERVYWFGVGLGTTPSDEKKTSGYLDTKTLDVIVFDVGTLGSNKSRMINSCYTYESEDGYIYFGDGYTGGADRAYNPYIYRLNPYDNTLTTIRTDFDDQMNSAVSDKAYFTIGETIYIMNTTNVIAINPKTGDFVEGEMPMVLGDPLNPAKKAIYNNTVYIVQDVADKTMVECTFYADSPPLAPIVAKIYKGQKFHSIVPFKLLRQGIEVTTVQQTATEDIEVKMYDYSSEGGQLLYIET